MAAEQGHHTAADENLATLGLIRKECIPWDRLRSVGITWREAAYLVYRIKTSYRGMDCWYVGRSQLDLDRLDRIGAFPYPYREVDPHPTTRLAGQYRASIRALLTLFGYRIPKGTQLVPTCGNHWCLNPGHREAVTESKRIDLGLDRNWRLISLPDGDWCSFYCDDGDQPRMVAE